MISRRESKTPSFGLRSHIGMRAGAASPGVQKTGHADASYRRINSTPKAAIIRYHPKASKVWRTRKRMKNLTASQAAMKDAANPMKNVGMSDPSKNRRLLQRSNMLAANMT